MSDQNRYARLFVMPQENTTREEIIRDLLGEDLTVTFSEPDSEPAAWMVLGTPLDLLEDLLGDLEDVQLGTTAEKFYNLLRAARDDRQRRLSA